MLPSSLRTSYLDSLQSNDELGLLDAIDKLRSQGVSHYVSLPQLIVCGDQSSGKSSVLEAISDVPFFTKDNLCTRFATELILRRGSTVELSIAIVPSQTRTEAECQRLSGFRETLTSLDEFPTLIDKAKDFMGISSTTSAFSNDVLRIEISGPDRPHLTIVDLPGLIHSENKLQTAADVSLVLSMVQSGHRTLGIITKPDTLPVGSQSDIGYANLARNKDVEFRLGWHGLRNRDYEMRNASMEARDKAEELFFSQGLWKEFPRDLVGIASLRARLSKVLLEQIRNEIPSLLEELEAKVQQTQKSLDNLGTRRATIDDQKMFLLNISQSFQSFVKAAVDGTYSNAFFGDPRSAEGYTKRFRAAVQNLNLEFAKTIRVRGHKRDIVNNIASAETSADPTQPQIIDLNKFLDDISEILKRSRGRELPGMFNPLIVGDLFHEQSEPWEKLIQQHLKAVWKMACALLELTMLHLTDEVTAEALLREVIHPLMEDRLRDMTAKLTELLVPYQKGHLITYNHYFTETIQSMRERRLEAEVARRLSRLFGLHDITVLEDIPSSKKIKTASLITALTSRNEADMDRYASSEILDCMQAFYKVAMKTVIDNVAILIVEILLVGRLEELLSPARILQMEPDLISRIAAESSENGFQREQLSRKLTVLQAGIETCKRQVSRNITYIQRYVWDADLLTSSEEVLDSSDEDTASHTTEANVPDVDTKASPIIAMQASSFLLPTLNTDLPAEPVIVSLERRQDSSGVADNSPQLKSKKKKKKAKASIEIN